MVAVTTPAPTKKAILVNMLEWYHTFSVTYLESHQSDDPTYKQKEKP
jgi:hypothetical protein